MTQKLRAFSPLALLGLAACGGESTTGQTTQSQGVAVKGLLQNALAFVDSNNDGNLSAGEVSTRTNADGEFTLNNPDSAPIVIITDDTTVDKSSGAVLSGLKLKAAADAKVVSTFTTLQADGVDTAALATALGLEGVELDSFNPYAEGVDAATALKVEKVSHQVVATLKVLAGAQQGADGSTSDDAFGKAFESLAEVAKEQLAGSGQIKLDDATLLNSVAAKVKEGGSLTDAQITKVVEQIKALNETIDAVDDLDSQDARDAFSASNALSKLYSDDVDSAGQKSVADVVSNAAPTEIRIVAKNNELSVNETNDQDDDLEVGEVSIVDDAPDGTTFKISGPDGDKFELVDGKLRLKSDVQLDYETTPKLSLSLTATDPGGKSIVRTFEVNVKNVDEATKLTQELKITGGTEPGNTLTATFQATDGDNGDQGFKSVTYKWLADGAEIEGATGSTYTLTQNDAGKTISVNVELTDQGGSTTTLTSKYDQVIRQDVDSAPLQVRMYSGIEKVEEGLKKSVETAEAKAEEWANNVTNFMNDFQKTLDLVSAEVKESFRETRAAQDGASAQVAPADQTGPSTSYSIRLSDSNPDFVEWVARVDYDRDGYFDNWVEVEFSSINAKTFDDLLKLTSSINLKDMSTLNLVGQIDEIEFGTRLADGSQQEVTLSHYDYPGNTNYADKLNLSYEVRDTNGNRVNDPTKLERLELVGEFDNGIAPLLKFASQLATFEARKAPQLADFRITEAGTDTVAVDTAAYQAALDTYNAESRQGEYDLLTRLIGGGEGVAPIAGVEGFRLSYGKSDDGERARAMNIDLFDKPDADGDQRARIEIGDYTLWIKGNLPETPGELLRFVDPDGGISKTISEIKKMVADSSISADQVFDKLMNGLTVTENGDTVTLPGLKAGGLADIKHLSLRANDNSGGGNDGNVLEVSVEFEKIAKLLIEEERSTDDGDREPQVYFDSANNRSVAQDPQGAYVVLGEGINLDAFTDLLDLDSDNGAAVS